MSEIEQLMENIILALSSDEVLIGGAPEKVVTVDELDEIFNKYGYSIATDDCDKLYLKKS